MLRCSCDHVCVMRQSFSFSPGDLRRSIWRPLATNLFFAPCRSTTCSAALRSRSRSAAELILLCWRSSAFCLASFGDQSFLRPMPQHDMLRCSCDHVCVMRRSFSFSPGELRRSVCRPLATKSFLERHEDTRTAPLLYARVCITRRRGLSRPALVLAHVGCGNIAEHAVRFVA
jgi:hypothetical protein